MAKSKIHFQKALKAPIAEVYRAFTSPLALSEWFCTKAFAELKVDGHLAIFMEQGLVYTGKFQKIEPNRKVTFTWHGNEPTETLVSITLVPKDDLVQLTLDHSGFGEEPEWQDAYNKIKTFWERGLFNLELTLTTGEDARVTRRPMMGIYPSDVTPELAKKKDYPVDHGVHIDSVIPGMGADKAGLMEGDIIVQIGKVSVPDNVILRQNIDTYHAGDTAKFTVFRGNTTLSTDVTYGFFKVSDIPFDPHALAGQYRSSIREAYNNLKELFHGASAEHCSARLEPESWSANEVIAHLIHGQRGLEQYIHDLLSDQTSFPTGYADNAYAMVLATTKVYPTTQELLNALHSSIEEIAILVENIPENFLVHKGTWWNIGNSLMGVSRHIEGHFDQIKKSLTTGR
jgi:uncharacterized protein YndB with AHSA1/START domain